MWDTTMITMLRILIQDYESEEFSDDRLKQILVVAAQYVVDEMVFDTTYTINVVTPDISPDPTASDPDHTEFINFTVLKAACVLDIGSMRAAALVNGLDASCGPVKMKVARRVEGFGTLIDKGYCAAYEEAKKQYNFGNTKHIRAVLSPFVNKNFFPSYHARYNSFFRDAY